MSTEKAPPAELVREIKELIIEALMLQDMRPEDIDEQAPLLVEGLGLDSIDVLELIVLLDRKYGVRISDPQQGREVFRNVTTMADFITANTSK